MAINAIPTSALESLSTLLGNEPDVAEEDNIDEVDDSVSENDSENDEPSDEETSSEDEDGDDAEQQEESTEEKILSDDELDSIKLEIDGEVIGLKDLKSGFLRQSDYTRKTQELAAQRKEVEAYARDAEAKANELVQQRFELVALDVEKRLQQYQDLDWKALSRANPADYTALRNDYEETVQEARTLQAEYEKIVESKSRHVEQQKLETAKHSYEVLSKEIPNWGKDVYSDILSFAVQNGMPQDAASNIVDAPTLKMMYKAMMFDKSKTEISTKTKPNVVSSVTKVIKQKATKDTNENEAKNRTKGKLVSQVKNSSSKLDKEASAINLVMARLEGKI